MLLCTTPGHTITYYDLTAKQAKANAKPDSKGSLPKSQTKLVASKSKGLGITAKATPKSDADEPNAVDGDQGESEVELDEDEDVPGQDLVSASKKYMFHQTMPKTSATDL